MFDRIAASPSKSLLFCACAFIAGVTIHALDERPWNGGAVFLTAIVICAILTAGVRKPVPRLIMAAAILVVAALWRYDRSLQAVPPLTALPPGMQRFRGTLRDEPKIRVHDTIHVMDRVFVRTGSDWQPLASGIEVRGGPLTAAHYGDEVEWRCTADEARRSMMLLRRIGWRCSVRESPVIIGRAASSHVKNVLVVSRSAMRRAAAELYPEPESSLLLGLLIGDTDGIPSDLRDAFRRTGTSHILAVSGYNVTRVIEIVLIVSTLAFAARKRAAAATAAAVFGFVLLSGAEASVVRAGVMGGVSLLARLLGRRYSGTNALVCAAAVMLAVAPFSLRHDVGFQLSFAAVWGLHALGPPFVRWARFVPETFGLRTIFGETLAATAATLPISLAVFGMFSPLSPLINVLVLPLIPLAMGTGAVSLAIGMLHPALGMPIAFVAALILRFVAVLVQAFAALPLTFPVPVTPAVAALLYAWIILLWYALTRASASPPLRLFVLQRRKPPEFIVEVVDHGS